jgi:hypothetical protein
MADTYTTRLQKVGALLPEMRRLILDWDDSPECADRAIEDNVLAAPSRLRARDVVKRGFVPRYVESTPPRIWRALAVLERGDWPTQSSVPLHYYCCAASERLMWDFVTEWVAGRYSAGLREVRTADAVSLLDAAPASRFPDGRWSPTVSVKVAQGLLTTLRDFGILAGAAKKEIAPIYLPTESFAFIAMARHEAGVRARALRDDPVWQLYLLSPTAVDRFFVEAQQRRLLTYAAAGSVVRIEFPASTLEEYAHALAQGSR